ncbi:hypothetical protein FACS1894152_6720 [Bacilli bacterium]|nr:hypothetical protein FACS1894152_6720 [Bacilli bacterium]
MRIQNIFHGCDIKGLNKINPEMDYLKNEEIKKRKKSHDIFRRLLEQNRTIKRNGGKIVINGKEL